MRVVKDSFDVRDLVLVGGGHSHIQVLKSFGMNPVEGVRITLISQEVSTPYSGMVPGYIAGIYDHDQVHVDLGRLTQFANSRLIKAQVDGIDLANNRVEMKDHPPVRFDHLSINTGGISAAMSSNGFPIKPLSGLMIQIEKLAIRIKSRDRIAIVGGGLGGAELALSLRTRFGDKVRLTIVADQLKWDKERALSSKLSKALLDAEIEVVSGFRVENYDGCNLVGPSNSEMSADYVIWANGVLAPRWPAESGFSVDDDGFILIDKELRSVSHPSVFVTGDISAMSHQKRARSGVIAVRQGQVLIKNLQNILKRKRLRQFRAQQHVLQLIGIGGNRAIAVKAFWAAQGRWVWRWKRLIDERFVRRFTNLPELERPILAGPESLSAEMPDPLRCGGCGSKIDSGVLQRVLSRLPSQSSESVLLGMGDDAAVLSHSANQLILTVDGFRSLVTDPYLFGRITAHHALNDILAMGGKGISALASVTIPVMKSHMMEDDLYQLLKGSVDVLNQYGIKLVGGHSAEGQELALSLTITGEPIGDLWRKENLLSGQTLVMTKPIGTGVVLAADMRGLAKRSWVDNAISSMDTSNVKALSVFRKFDCVAATDVSGFGIGGHLLEMLRASNVGVRLSIGSIPLLPGAKELLIDGVVSSLQEQNEFFLEDFKFENISSTDPSVRLFVDPQTSGGLLAAVEPDCVEKCLLELRVMGFSHAAAIGQLLPSEDGWLISP